MAMVVKDGFKGFSMQKLAKAARVSPATIYIYWKDRDDLLLQLYADAWAKMSEKTLTSFDPGMSFQEGLKTPMEQPGPLVPRSSHRGRLHGTGPVLALA